MAVPDYAHGIGTSFLATMNARTRAIQSVSITPAATAATQTARAGGSFLDNVLDIVNPLQHLPVVGTLYRAVTGDKIGDVAQLAGDTLYGGAIGLGSSVANLIFKHATGKDFGDTVLSWVEGLGSDGTTAVAEAKTGQNAAKIATAAPATFPSDVARKPSAPASVEPAQARILTDPTGFMDALKAKGIDPALGLRAMQAYEKSLGLAQP